jgi:uncharacterized UPF0160 family protein
VFGHGYVTKLSSAGLVYKHYGRTIVAQVTPQAAPRLRKQSPGDGVASLPSLSA